MKQLFDKVSQKTSKLVTKSYSTSFSLSIHCLDKSLHEPIYSIYGYVRLADEIVDSFHNYNKKQLLNQLKEETFEAIKSGISLNPIINSFILVVNKYNIDHKLIHLFLKSMETDLDQPTHTIDSYNEYILGSAQVVGLMCLAVFTDSKEQYRRLTEGAMKLGSVFQKVNFLRDIKNDKEVLGRTYFPGITELNESSKLAIEAEIEEEFQSSLRSIRELPKSSRFGVWVAWTYYYNLFNKIRVTSADDLLKSRIRISNFRKIELLVSCLITKP